MDHLTSAQRAELRERVAFERARTTARAAALERDFDEIVSASADAVRDDEHDPEGATIAYERAKVSALLADAAAQLTELSEADARFEQGTAASCVACGAPIPFERLLARPTATRCVACAAAAAQGA